MSTRLEPVEFSLPGLSIRGIRRRALSDNTEARLLCLHGWLDNAASFLPLMPHLPNIDIVAIDLPGHGYSDHAPTGTLAGYSLFDYVATARAVITALDWSHCHVAGHSLGGGIVPMLAVAAPELVDSVLLIEAAGPLSEDDAALPQRLARALDDRMAPGRYTSRTFASKEDAVDARLKAARMARSSARLIIDRQVAQRNDGWVWRFDPALRHASPQYQTESQVRAVLAAVSCPSLTIVAKDGFLADKPALQERLAALPDNTRIDVPGQHHLHMDTPEPVAAAINRFLGATPALGG